MLYEKENDQFLFEFTEGRERVLTTKPGATIKSDMAIVFELDLDLTLLRR